MVCEIRCVVMGVVVEGCGRIGVEWRGSMLVG